MSMMLSRHISLIIFNFLYRRLKRIVPFYYLIVLLTTCSLIFLPFANITPNLASSWNAIFLTTNLVKNDDMGYFEKLGLTRDMFTHTWSLCLEMQFYLIFPFIWMAQSLFSDFPRLCFLYFIGGLSIAVYVFSDELSSFNSVAARMWQFVLGNVVFLLDNNYDVESSRGYSLLKTNQEVYEEENLLEQKQPHSAVTAEWVTTSFALTLLIFTSVSKEHLDQDYARLTITIISSIMILFGRKFSLLECKPMVFLGEISYSWYLVHWPILSVQKLLELDSTFCMFVGLAISFFIAVMLHYIFEKSYLHWEKRGVFAFVISTMLLAIGVIFALQAYTMLPPKTTMYRFSSMTREEVKTYNIESDKNDHLQLRMLNCTYIPEINRWYGYCEYQYTNKKRNNSILIIGNSWAANQASVLFQECSQNAGIMAVHTIAATEVLYGNKDPYTHDVKRMRPNQLFIIARSVQFHLKRDKPSMINVINAAAEKLKFYSTLVTDKIYILTVFPSFSQKIASILNAAIDKGITPKYDELLQEKEQILNARNAMKEVVRNCSKCVLYDYVPSFESNGTVLPYDQTNLISYHTVGKHLTTAGLEKIHHVYADICKKI